MSGSESTGNGTENMPYASIAKGVLNAGDGGTVYLKTGDYKLTAIRGAALNHWTPGQKPEDVRILTRGPDSTSTARYVKNRIRWHNLSLYCERTSAQYGTILHLETGNYVWLDGINIHDKTGAWNETALVGGTDPVPFYTNSHIYEVSNVAGDFHRNLYLEKIGSDVYRGTDNLMAANVTVNVIDRGPTLFHPDFIQFHNPGSLVENLVFYNMSRPSFD